MPPKLSFLVSFLVLSLWHNARVQAQGNWTTNPFNPPSMPLAVKSPYLNAWAPLGFQTNGSAALNRAWPTLFDARRVLGWFAAVRVDGEAYSLLGNENNADIPRAVQQSFVFSPTRSSFIMQAGPVNVNVTFMTPIEAEDITRQSMPFSYLYFDIESTDGNTHSVQVYSDVSGEWISGDNSLTSSWQINESSNFVYLQMQLTTPRAFQEIGNQAQDATLYYCMEKGGVTWQIGPAGSLRNLFANGTGLDNRAEDGPPHPIDTPFTNLAIAVDLSNIRTTNVPVVYAIGLVRDPVIQYANRLVQIEQRSAYYWSEFANIHDAVQDVLGHFNDALTAAIDLDNKVLEAAGEISDEYGQILSLSSRQAMGALDYTLPKSADGTFNTSDVKAFMKDIGGIGSGGVSAVDVLYSAMPMYLYLNPDILGYLLSPLLEYQESTQYRNPYAAQDLGGSYPNATGNPNGHDQKIEHSASMLIMSLAHAQASGDGTLLAQHYDLLNQWASYLVNDTMHPADETTSTSDGIRGNKQTNLILKGIIGIAAMAKISGYTGHSDDQSHFNEVAKQYIAQWTSLASSSGQLDLGFGTGSSGLIYNLYADKLLALDLVDKATYDLQTSFYRGQASLWTYGIPLDSSNTSSITRSDWMMLAAASASDNSVRNAMISRVWQYAAVNGDNLPFPIAYNPDDGSWTAGPNSPAVGAMFAPLALNVPIKSVSLSGSNDSGSSPNVGAIVGAAIGGVVGVGLITGLVFFFIRRRRREEESTGIYNRTDRIERIKPTNFPSESVLEPLSSTVYPGMNDMRAAPYSVNASGTLQTYGSSNNVVLSPPPGPFYLRNLADSELAGAGDGGSTILDSNSFGTSRPMPTPSRPNTKGAVHQEELRSEVDNLRREIERMKEERAALGEAPPSYEEELALSRRTGFTK